MRIKKKTSIDVQILSAVRLGRLAKVALPAIGETNLDTPGPDQSLALIRVCDGWTHSPGRTQV